MSEKERCGHLDSGWCGKLNDYCLHPSDPFNCCESQCKDVRVSGEGGKVNCPKCEEVQIDPRDAYYHTIGGRHLCKTCYLEERDANRPMTQSDLMRQIADLQQQLAEAQKEIERLRGRVRSVTEDFFEGRKGRVSGEDVAAILKGLLEESK